MRVLVAGGTGLLGTALARALRDRGDEVVVLTRGPDAPPELISWDLRRGVRQQRRLEGVEAVVNLVGEPLAARPWTPARRRQLVASRVEPTDVLGEALASLDVPPRTYVGVSAIGIHAPRGDAWIDDDDAVDKGFLPDLAVAWEAAHARAAEGIGARLAILRMGVVLAAEGGLFPALLVPFRTGVGGWAGDGRAYAPWISLHDAVRAIVWLLDHPEASGAFHGTVPSPPSNRELCEALGEAVGRPVTGHAPAWVLRGALGELADALFLSSRRARPSKLMALDFVFDDPDIRVFAARAACPSSR